MTPRPYLGTMAPPPDVCALGHEHNYADCTACEDVAAEHEDYNAWLQTDEAEQLMEMDEADDARWLALGATRLRDTDNRYGRGFGEYR